MPSRVSVPLSSDMDDETFIAHWNKRHRETDTPFLMADVPYHAGMECGYMRAFHIHCHTAERDGGTIQARPDRDPFTPEYDHEHEEG